MGEIIKFPDQQPVVEWEEIEFLSHRLWKSDPDSDEWAHAHESLEELLVRARKAREGHFERDEEGV